VRSADVKWVTPRTYRLWRHIGLLGYDAGGQPDSSWRGRNDGRNATSLIVAERAARVNGVPPSS
jgi:hypothetical protein